MKTLEEFLKENGAQYNEKTNEFTTNCKGESIIPYKVKGNEVWSNYSGWLYYTSYSHTVFNVFHVKYDARLQEFLFDYDNILKSYVYINKEGKTYSTYNISDLVLDKHNKYYTEKENCVKIGNDYVFKRYANYYKECPCCHRAFSCSSIDTDDMCSICRMETRAQVCGYHSHKDGGVIKFFGAKQENFKGYGLELECEGNVNSNYSTQDCRNAVHNLLGDRVYFEYDGSLRNDGFETITRPHTKEELFKIDWQKVLKCYSDNGLISHTTNRCGLHIHASRTLFGDNKETQDDNIAKVIFFYEYFWNDVVKFSRRNNFSYCEKILRDGYITQERSKEEVKRPKHRYRAVNTNNDNTIEFRLPRGTLKYETFMATLDFTIKIVENAIKIKWEDITNKDKWLEGITDATRQYLTKRHSFTDKVYKTTPRSIGEI